MDDQADRFKQHLDKEYEVLKKHSDYLEKIDTHRILGITVLDFLGLRWLLGLKNNLKDHQWSKGLRRQELYLVQDCL